MKSTLVSKIWAWALAPELMWGAAIALTYWLCSRNQPATEAGSRALEKWWWLIPLVFVTASFARLLIPELRSGWALARIDIAGCIGLFLCATKITESIDYHDSRNSGTFAGWFMSMLLGVFLLAIGNVVVGIAAWMLARKAAS